MRIMVPLASPPLCLVILVLSGCGADEGTNLPPEPPVEPTGHIEVALAVSGNPPDPDGVLVVLDGHEGFTLQDGASQVFADLATGSHAVHISDVAWHCELAGEPTRAVEVRVDQTSRVPITVTCRNIGVLSVRTRTAGSAADPDGYTVELEGQGVLSVTDGTTAIWPELEAGPYRVVLSGVEDHCWIPGESVFTIEIVATDTTQIDIGIACPPFLDHIAFGSSRDGDGDLWVMRGNGTSPVNLTPGEFGGNDPSWSPDGSRIAFLGGPPDGIWVMEMDGSALRWVGEGRSPQWSPDGQRILFVRLGWVKVMDADGSNVANVVDSVCESPQWSPDGLQVAFASGQDCGEGDPDFNKSIYVVNVDGTDRYRVSPGATPDRYDVEPAWFPGTRIALVGWTDLAAADIYSMEPDGSDLIRLTHSERGVYAYEPQWSPDGEWVVFSHNPGQGSRQICVVGADGSGYRCLTRGAFYHGYPSWSPGQ